mgnify:CR=1 FL=1
MLFPPIISPFIDGGLYGVIDRYGHLYWGFYAGAGFSVGLSLAFGEGYVAPYKSDILPQLLGEGSIPTQAEVASVITGWCGNFSGGIGFTGSVSFCQNLSKAVTFSYLNIGVSANLSSAYSTPFQATSLAWDYIDRKPGISEQEVILELYKHAGDC